MINSPAFQFYPEAFIVGTSEMLAAEVGGYIRLLCHQWDKGGILNNDEFLSKVTGCNAEELARIKEKFSVRKRDGKLINKRLERVRRDLQSFRARQKKNAESRWGLSDGKTRASRMTEAKILGTHTKKEWELMREVHDWKCAKCLRRTGLVKDHIKPIYMKGSDSIENIQPLCTKCNGAKGSDATDYRRLDWREKIKENACQTPAASLPNACSLSVPLSIPLVPKTDRETRAREPRDEVEAGEWAEMSGVPADFGKRIFNQLVSRSWLDGAGQPIGDFRAHVKYRWSREESERAERKLKRPEPRQIDENIKVRKL